MKTRTALVLAIAAASLPAAATEPAGPSEELLEYLGSWNGDEDWLHSDEVVAASAPPAQRGGKSGREDSREDPATAQDRTERGR